MIVTLAGDEEVKYLHDFLMVNHIGFTKEPCRDERVPQDIGAVTFYIEDYGTAHLRKVQEFLNMNWDIDTVFLRGW